MKHSTSGEEKAAVTDKTDTKSSDRPRELLIVVPRNTRVKYAESDYTDEPLIIDLDILRDELSRKPTQATEFLYSHQPSPSFTGLPIFDVERYTHWREQKQQKQQRETES